MPFVAMESDPARRPITVAAAKFYGALENLGVVTKDDVKPQYGNRTITKTPLEIYDNS
jgi:hypothetical protein